MPKELTLDFELNLTEEELDYLLSGRLKPNDNLNQVMSFVGHILVYSLRYENADCGLKSILISLP